MINSLSRKNFPMYDVGNEIDTGVMATTNITVYIDRVRLNHQT